MPFFELGEAEDPRGPDLKKKKKAPVVFVLFVALHQCSAHKFSLFMTVFASIQQSVRALARRGPPYL